MYTADVDAVGLEAPSARISDTADSEEEDDDRLRLPMCFGAMEEGKRAGPLSEENGATVNASEVAMGRVGLGSSQPALDANVARAPESVHAGVSAGESGASQVESNEGVEGGLQVAKLSINGGEVPWFCSRDILRSNTTSGSYNNFVSPNPETSYQVCSHVAQPDHRIPGVQFFD